MTGPKLYILPARNAPALMLPEEPRRPLQKTRIYDANGTEFVGIESATTEHDPQSPVYSITTIRMRLGPFDVVVLDAPPPSLTDRLRAMAAKWCEGSTGPSADRANTAAEVARETCAEELEALLDEVKQC